MYCERFRIWCWSSRQIEFRSYGCCVVGFSRVCKFCELPGLLDLFPTVDKSLAYLLELEQGCLPTLHDSVYVQWFVCFAQDGLWTEELTSEPSALILSAPRNVDSIGHYCIPELLTLLVLTFLMFKGRISS